MDGLSLTERGVRVDSLLRNEYFSYSYGGRNRWYLGGSPCARGQKGGGGAAVRGCLALGRGALGARGGPAAREKAVADRRRDDRRARPARRPAHARMLPAHGHR